MARSATGAYFNDLWRVGAAHALFNHDGHWYHQLRRFPGAWFDRNGYILFRTEEEFRGSPYLSIGKQVSIRKPGISAIPGYVRVTGNSSRPETSPPEEVVPDVVFSEGAVVQIRVNQYERDQKARERCIEHHGPQCSVCGFDFARSYGLTLSGFIHVHHLTPLASVGVRYRVDPVADLRPICANCHAVVHRREPPYTIEEVRAMAARAREGNAIRGTR